MNKTIRGLAALLFAAVPVAAQEVGKTEWHLIKSSSMPTEPGFSTAAATRHALQAGPHGLLL